MEHPSDTNTEKDNMKQKSSAATIILVGVIMLFLGFVIGWYFGQNYSIDLKDTNSTDTPSPAQPTTSQVSPTADEQSIMEPTVSPTSIPTVACTNNMLGLTMELPTDWTCENEEFFMTITSDKFTINISNLGRGGPCPIGEDAPECIDTEFYTRDSIEIKEYTTPADGGKSIFGFVSEGTWIDISYSSMGERDLTDEERTELFTVLDSIETEY